MRRLAGVLIAIAGAGLTVASDYVQEANGCVALTEYIGPPPHEYDFWCIQHGQALGIALGIGLILTVSGFVWFVVAQIRSRASRPSN